MNPERNLVSLPKVVFPAVVGEFCSENQYLCTHCKIIFSLEKDLIIHLTVGIPGAKIQKIRERVSYICEGCGLNFFSYLDVKQHYDKVHLKINSFPCPTCGKSFKDKYSVKFHSRYMHDKSKRFECQICSKVYFNKYSHKVHLSKCLRRNSKNN